jgi:preprotein translocase subunit SecE
MKELLPIIIGILVVSVAFVLLLRAGYFLKISAYWMETMEEMKKCTWPTWDELMGSTVVVSVAVVALGGFTVLADLAIATIIKSII